MSDHTVYNLIAVGFDYFKCGNRGLGVRLSGPRKRRLYDSRKVHCDIRHPIKKHLTDFDPLVFCHKEMNASMSAGKTVPRQQKKLICGERWQDQRERMPSVD